MFWSTFLLQTFSKICFYLNDSTLFVRLPLTTVSIHGLSITPRVAFQIYLDVTILFEITHDQELSKEKTQHLSLNYFPQKALIGKINLTIHVFSDCSRNEEINPLPAWLLFEIYSPNIRLHICYQLSIPCNYTFPGSLYLFCTFC